MDVRSHRRLAVAVLSWLMACSPDPQAPIEGIGARDAAADARPGLDPEPFAYAVVAADYTVSTIALLEPDGTLLKRDFVNSGSARAGLVTALSGDVILPTRSGDRGVLVLIDRFRTDVITRIDLASGDVLGQVKTQAPNRQKDASGYSSNPQDYVYLDAGSAWVSRFEPNLAASRNDADRGLDLLALDPTRFELKAERIDFHRFDATAERTNPDSGATETVQVFARPGKLVRLGDKLVVGITRMSAGFDAVGEGMVALVDLETRAIEGLPLPGLANCTQVVPVPDDDTRVAVGCTGFYRRVTRDEAGIAMLRLEDGELTVERLWRAKDDPALAEATSCLVALDAEQVIAVETGASESDDDDGKPAGAATRDRLYQLDLAAGEQTLIFEAEGRFVIGSAAYDPRRRILLVPDASTDARARPTAGVRRFERGETGAFEALDVIAIDPILPPRQVRAID